MKLSDLDGNVLPSIVIVQTPSVRMQTFLQDKVKLKIQYVAETEIEVKSKSDYKRLKEVAGVAPPFSERWFVFIDLDKLLDKALLDLMKVSTTCCFFCVCSRYKTFSECKTALKGLPGVMDFYITYLRRADLVYIYDALTLSDNKLSKPLFDFVAQGYSGDIDMVFDLFLAMNQGKVFESRKAIIDHCGIGGLTVDSFLFSMLKPLSGSEKGLKSTMKNRVKAMSSLGESLGYSSFYNFLSKAILCLCELKMLMISGVVYKEVRKLPGTFDEKSLHRYQRHLWRLRQIPMSDLLILKQCMGGNVWSCELDAVHFLYKYYETKGAMLCQ